MGTPQDGHLNVDDDKLAHSGDAYGLKPIWPDNLGAEHPLRVYFSVKPMLPGFNP